jgi:hypothetical protein
MLAQRVGAERDESNRFTLVGSVGCSLSKVPYPVAIISSYLSRRESGNDYRVSMLMTPGETELTQGPLLDVPLSGIPQEEGVSVNEIPCSTVSTVCKYN